MSVKNPAIDLYLADGCGRCSLYATPQCKVHSWTKELKRLRKIALDSGLAEELKWGVPCYTFEKKNIVIISALKDYCSFGFFKGVLLKDEAKILVKPGDNSQSSRLVRFTSTEQIAALEPNLREYIREAIEIEQSGKKVDFKAKSELQFPAELVKKFESMPALHAAFSALTPGRQRGYILHFSTAKQSQTRESRIDKCIPAILEGRGLHD